MYNIGLVVGNVEDPFSNQVCKGAMRAAEMVGDRLFIFPVKYLNRTDSAMKDPRQQFEYQYNFLLSYAQSHSLDMVILCLSTIAYHTEREEYLAVLRNFDIPVLLVAGEEEGYSCVKYDNASGLKEGIRYLIEERNCRHIGMLTGSLANNDAMERLQAYKEVLMEKGLPIEESKIAYGDLSEKCVAEVEALLLNNSELDAIVCANDSMAKAVYKVLNKFDFIIGKDICVLGFDDVEESAFMEPPLATVRADASTLGYRAMMEVHDIMAEYFAGNKEHLPLRQLKVETSFVKRESVSGKKKTRSTSSVDIELKYKSKIQMMKEANHRLNIITRDMLMFGNGSVRNFSEFLNAFVMEGIESCYLFLLDKPITYHEKENYNVVNSLYLQAYKEGEQVIEYHKDEKKIGLNDLFKNECLKDKAKNYIVIDIYSREIQYGVMVCDMPHKYFDYVESLCFLISLATKIIDLLIVQEALLSEKESMLQKLEQENLILDNISNKDELTGICNRRGFITKTLNILNNAENVGKQAVILYADLNYLKLINDKYSHAAGNYALQSCANALERIVGNNGVVGRIGGDEFALFTMIPYSGESVRMKNQLHTYMDHVNGNSNKPFEVTMSVGAYEFTIEKGCELKELIKEADRRLYIDKKNKKPFVEK